MSPASSAGAPVSAGTPAPRPPAASTDARPGATVATTADRVRAWRRAARRRPRAVVLVLAVLLVAAAAVRVLLGTYTVTLPDFFTILGGNRVEGAPAASFIVMQDKLPRAVLGAMVGLAFGVSGAVFQLLLRNPLASPDIIGISASSSLGAITALAFFGATGLGLSAGGLLGALVATLVIFGLSAGGASGGVGNRFVLVGLGISVLAAALTNFMLLRINIYQAADAAIWMTGSLNSADWLRIRLMGLVLLVVLPLLVLLSGRLHAMSVGDELARGLGVPVAAVRWSSIVLAVVLAAFAVAAAGPISFVAFVSGPVARRLVGGTHSLVAAGLVGAVVVVLADFSAANLIPGGSLPVGVVTGVVGAPVLLWLLVSAQKERS